MHQQTEFGNPVYCRNKVLSLSSTLKLGHWDSPANYNSLAYGRYDLRLDKQIHCWYYHPEHCHRQCTNILSFRSIDHTSSSVQVMAWCVQAASQYSINVIDIAVSWGNRGLKIFLKRSNYWWQMCRFLPLVVSSSLLMATKLPLLMGIMSA